MFMDLNIPHPTRQNSIMAEKKIAQSFSDTLKIASYIGERLYYYHK